MRDFHEVLSVLKTYLAERKNGKILDKDVAQVLEMTQSNFATIKRRNSMPYENILKFCKKEKLCCNDIFFR